MHYRYLKNNFFSNGTQRFIHCSALKRFKVRIFSQDLAFALLLTFSNMKNKRLNMANDKIFKVIKICFQLLQKRYDNKSILLILGCQRSGTTLATKIFEKDFHIKVFGEFSRLSSNDSAKKIRLNPHESLNEVFNVQKSRFIVLKPLVESQNAHLLLENFPNSKIVWMFRDYKDVAMSNIKKFGKNNGINDLKSIVIKERNNWRSEKLSDETREIIIKHYSPHMNPFDAAALFWYARNSLYYSLELNRNDRVMLCAYKNLVLQPKSTIESIYQFGGQTYPGDRIIKGVYTRSLGKGSIVKLSEEINELCSNLMMDLEKSDIKTISII